MVCDYLHSAWPTTISWGASPPDLRLIKRQEEVGKKLFQRDQREMERFIARADREFLALSRSRILAGYAKEIAKQWPPAKQPYQFAKLLRSDGKVRAFADTFVGPSREGQVRYKLRDLHYKKQTDLGRVILSGKPALAFDTKTFIQQAMKSASGTTLLDLLGDLEDDLGDSGVSIPRT